MKKILYGLPALFALIPQVAFARSLSEEIRLLNVRVDDVNSTLTKLQEAFKGGVPVERFEALETYALNAVSNTLHSMMWFTATTLGLITIFFLLVAGLVGWFGYHKVLRIANEKINRKVEVAVRERLRAQAEENRRLYIGAEIANPLYEFGVTTEENDDGSLNIVPDENFLKERAELRAKRKKELEQQATLSIFNLSEPLA